MMLACSGSADDLDLSRDGHVKLMSPRLIKYVMSRDGQLDRPLEQYFDMTTVKSLCGVQGMDVISMGNMYRNINFFPEGDGLLRMQQENDFILSAAQSCGDACRAYIAVDPLLNDAVEELQRCHELDSTIGLWMDFKVSNVYLTSYLHRQYLKDILQECSRRSIPVYVQLDPGHPRYGIDDMRFLMDSVMTTVGHLSMRVAHMGGSGGFHEANEKIINQYLEYREQGKVPERHDIQWDLSAVGLDKTFERSKVLSEEQFEKLEKYIADLGSENIVFGSRYPLYDSQDYISVLRDNGILP